MEVRIITVMSSQHLPTIDSNHSNTWEIETNATRNDSIGWR